jgi:hypothetical protein
MEFILFPLSSQEEGISIDEGRKKKERLEKMHNRKLHNVL